MERIVFVWCVSLVFLVVALPSVESFGFGFDFGEIGFGGGFADLGFDDEAYTTIVIAEPAPDSAPMPETAPVPEPVAPPGPSDHPSADPQPAPLPEPSPAVPEPALASTLELAVLPPALDSGLRVAALEVPAVGVPSVPSVYISDGAAVAFNAVSSSPVSVWESSRERSRQRWEVQSTSKSSFKGPKSRSTAAVFQKIK